MLGSQYLGQLILASALAVAPAPTLEGGGGLGTCRVGGIVLGAGCVVTEYTPPVFTGGGGLGTCRLGGIVLAAGCVVGDEIPPPPPPPPDTGKSSGGGTDYRHRRQKQLEAILISFLNTQD